MSAPRRPRRRLLPRLTIANLCVLVLLWLGETFVAERHWLTTVLAYAPQHLFGVPALLLLLWALGRREWRAMAGNAAALAFFAVLLLGVNLPLGAPAAAGRPDGVSFRVMTFNIHHGSAGAARVAAVVKRERPDLLCVQEASAYQQWPDPVPELQRLLPGWQMARHGELATFSRQPIRSQRIHRLVPGTGRAALETVVDAGKERLTVLNVHLSTAAGPQSLGRREGSMTAYLEHTAAVRMEQVAEILRLAEAASTPVLVAGDFNTPPRGLAYRRMTTRLRDAFCAAGWGLGHTYPAHFPLLRIDYVFVSEGIGVRACGARRTGDSDHWPVVAEIAVR